MRRASVIAANAAYSTDAHGSDPNAAHAHDAHRGHYVVVRPRVLLQFLRQLSAWCGLSHIARILVITDIQLLDKAHGT